MSSEFEPPRKLTEQDSVHGFSCGVEVIDQWVASHALKAERYGTSVVYGVYAGDHLAGIYALSTHSIVRDKVKSGWLRRNVPKQIPTILLGMLGVDERYQNRGLGASLLGDAIRRSLNVAKEVGAKALIVDPVDKRVEDFYRKYGFKPMLGTSKFYVPLVLK